ncbi:MAG TPA: hypothetical protein VGC06_03380 [Actinomycetes bacterium]
MLEGEDLTDGQLGQCRHQAGGMLAAAPALGLVRSIQPPPPRWSPAPVMIDHAGDGERCSAGIGHQNRMPQRRANAHGRCWLPRTRWIPCQAAAPTTQDRLGALHRAGQRTIRVGGAREQVERSEIAEHDAVGRPAIASQDRL